MDTSTSMKTNQSALSHNRKETSNSTASSNNMSSLSSSCSICASTTHPQISVSDTLKLVIELLGNCNAMSAMNANSIKDTKKRYADSTANTNRKFDILLASVKDIEDRLDGIDQQKKASTDIIKLDEQVKDVASSTKDTKIIDKRLKSLSGRVSSIEHLCVIRSNYNKKRRVSQE